MFHQTECKDIYKRIGAVAICEIDLAAYSRASETVAVIAYAFYDACHQAAIARQAERPESETVENSQRARSHCKDVAQYSTNTSRRPLIRLNEAWVIMRLYLESDAPVPAYIYYAGILARSLEHPLARCRKSF